MTVGSAHGVRTMAPIPSTDRRRRGCSCCGKRVTHRGFGDGVALMSGCEWHVRKWVKDPSAALRMGVRRREMS